MTPAMRDKHHALVKAGLGRWYKTLHAIKEASGHTIDSLVTKNWSKDRHIAFCEAMGAILSEGLELYTKARTAGLDDTADRIMEQLRIAAQANEVLIHLTEEILDATDGVEAKE